MAAKKKAVKSAPADARLDSYQEIFLNVGTAGDPFNYGGIGAARIMRRPELERIYMSDGVGRRIVDIVPEEMMRSGFNVEGIDNMDEVKSKWDAIDATNKLTDAMIWARLFGGSIVIMGIDDGSANLSEPAGEGEIDFLRVYDRYSAQVYAREENSLLKNFGEPTIWEITPMVGPTYYVHASRCIVFDGERVPERVRQRNNGWGASILQCLSGALKDFGISHQMATSLLARKQQGVWGIKDLSMMCRDRDGKVILKERLNQVDMTRGNNNSIALDADTETYTLLNGDLSGVKDVIGEKKNLLTMLTGIHESILTGENVSGINANENTALASFHQLIERSQVDVARPAIEILLNRMGLNAESWKIEFNPLSVESDAQKADRLQKEADADTKYEAAQILDADELRDTLRKRGHYVMKDGAADIKESQNDPDKDAEILNNAT